jgi:hypothetical protein
MPLLFWFTVRELRQSRGYPPRDTGYAWWKPAKPLGSNILDRNSGRHNELWYHFDGMQLHTVNVEEIRRLMILDLIIPFRDTSVYYDGTASRFWSVDYDASRYPVGDGLPHDLEYYSESEDEDEEDIETGRKDWERVGFDFQHNGEAYTGVSKVSCTPESYHLYMTRVDQEWPQRLLLQSLLP